MWVSGDGKRSFTGLDLHDAGVTSSRRGTISHRAGCCPACHGWGEWRKHPAGRVIHQLPTGARLICCCCWTFDRPDAWVGKKLDAWRRAVRRHALATRRQAQGER